MPSCRRGRVSPPPGVTPTVSTSGLSSIIQACRVRDVVFSSTTQAAIAMPSDVGMYTHRDEATGQLTVELIEPYATRLREMLRSLGDAVVVKPASGNLKFQGLR